MNSMISIDKSNTRYVSGTLPEPPSKKFKTVAYSVTAYPEDIVDDDNPEDPLDFFKQMHEQAVERLESLSLIDAKMFYDDKYGAIYIIGFEEKTEKELAAEEKRRATIEKRKAAKAQAVKDKELEQLKKLAKKYPNEFLN